MKGQSSDGHHKVYSEKIRKRKKKSKQKINQTHSHTNYWGTGKERQRKTFLAVQTQNISNHTGLPPIHQLRVMQGEKVRAQGDPSPSRVPLLQRAQSSPHTVPGLSAILVRLFNDPWKERLSAGSSTRTGATHLRLQTLKRQKDQETRAAVSNRLKYLRFSMGTVCSSPFLPCPLLTMALLAEKETNEDLKDLMNKTKSNASKKTPQN